MKFNTTCTKNHFFFSLLFSLLIQSLNQSNAQNLPAYSFTSWGGLIDRTSSLPLDPELINKAKAKNNPTADGQCDIVIIDSSLGSISAALQAVRKGNVVCMSSMTDWLGGQISTQGVSAIDGPNQFQGEPDNEFFEKYTTKNPDGTRTSIEHPYLSKTKYFVYPHEEEVERSLQQLISLIPDFSNCWVSHHCFKPKDADRAIKKLLDPYVKMGMLKIYYEAVPVSVETQQTGPNEQKQIISVTLNQRMFTGIGPKPYSLRLSEEFEDWYQLKNSQRYTKKSVKLSGQLFIDGTETAELAMLSGAHTRQGYDAREHADSFDLNTPSTNKTQDQNCLMAFSNALQIKEGTITDTQIRYLDPIQAPNNQTQFNLSQGKKYKFWAEDIVDQTTFPMSIFDYRKISENPRVSMINWAGGTDFFDENLLPPLSQLTEQLKPGKWRGGINLHALSASEARSLYFMKKLLTDPLVTASGRSVAPVTEHDNETNFFGTTTSLSKFPYIRESRKIIGYDQYVLTQDQVMTDKPILGELMGEQYSNLKDSIGIGSYSLDVRACPSKKPIGWKSKKFANHAQIPLRAMISDNISNLAVAGKSWSTTQAVNAAFRLQPTEWNAGFGVGSAAAIAQLNHIDFHQLINNVHLIEQTQRYIVKSKGRVLWFTEKIPADLQ